MTEPGKAVERSSRRTSQGADGRFQHDEYVARRDAEAARLRARGWSYAQIAEHMGYANHTGARQAVHRALQAVVQEPAEELRNLELARLDIMWQAAVAVLEANHYLVSQGRLIFLGPRPLEDDAPVLAALDRMLKIMERRARLLGLDAPARTRVEVVTEDAVDAEIARLEQELAAFDRSAAREAAPAEGAAPEAS